MKQITFAVLIFAFNIAAFAQGSNGLSTRNVESLNLVEFVRTLNNGMPADLMLNISFSSDGCNPKDNKVSFELKNISQQVVSDEGDKITEVRVKLKILVKETSPEVSCRMAYNITESVNLDELLKEQQVSLGLDLSKPNTYYQILFEAPPVTAHTSVYNY